MHLQPVAGVYAEALLAIAEQRGQTEPLAAELEDLSSLLAAAPEIRRFLETPVLDAAVKKGVLEKALGGQVQRVLVDFVCLLIDKGRIGVLSDIALAFRQRLDHAAGRVRVQATSATALTDADSRSLAELLRARLQSECIVETAVQPALLGGLVVTIGDTIYDGSVRAQLRRIREAMMRSSGYEN